MSEAARALGRFAAVWLGAWLALGGCKGGGGGGGAPPQPAALAPASRVILSLRGPDLMGQLGLYYAQFGLLLSAGDLPFVPGQRKALSPWPAAAPRLLALALPGTGGLRRVPRKTSLAGLRIAACREGSSQTRVEAIERNVIQSSTLYAACRGTLSSGEEVLLDGRVTARAEDPDYTGSNPIGDPRFRPTVFDLAYDAFHLEIRDPADPQFLEILEAAGSIHAVEETDQDELGRIEELVDGRFSTLAQDASVEEDAAFFAEGLSILYDIRAFGRDDLITDWSFTLTGRLLYEDCSRPGRGIDATLRAFRIDWLTTDPADILGFSGGFDADWLGGANDIETAEPFVVPFDADCPTSGRMLVRGDAGSYELAATPTGGIAIDIGADGSVEKSLSSCRDGDLGPIPAPGPCR